MVKNLPVSLLKQGDKFEFLIGRVDEAKPVLVVTRDPAVNKIANSCHFRYQPDRTATSVDNKWDDNHSWNGTPDTQVRLVEAHAEVAPPKIAAPEVTAPPQAAAPSQESVAVSKAAVKKTAGAAPKKKKA